jgi:hypothetical protein
VKLKFQLLYLHQPNYQKKLMTTSLLMRVMGVKL